MVLTQTAKVERDTVGFVCLFVCLFKVGNPCTQAELAAVVMSIGIFELRLPKHPVTAIDLLVRVS